MLLFRISAIFLLIGMCDIFTFPARLVGGDNVEIRQLIFQLLWGAAYSLFFVCALLNNRPKLNWRVGVLSIFSIYVVTSLLWVTYPSPRVDLAVGFAATLISGAIVAQSFPIGWCLQTLKRIITISAAVGLILYLAGVPTAIYIDNLDRSNILGMPPMMGVFSHKVQCALISVIGVVVNAADKEKLLRFSPATIICALSVLLSGSASGLLLLAFALLFAIVIRFSARLHSGMVSVSAIGFVVLALIAAVFGNQLALEILGRDVGLTGRAGFWQSGWQMVLSRPVLGWGYGGAFSGFGEGPFFDFFRVKYYTPVHMQNSFIQLLVELGFVGMIYFVIILASCIYFQIRAISALYDRNRVALLTILLVVIIDACAEHVLLGNSIGLFVVGLSLALNDQTFVFRKGDNINVRSNVKDRLSNL